LAFVLLVIFIITTTPVVNDLEVDLPSAAPRAKEPKPKVNYVTVDKEGVPLPQQRIASTLRGCKPRSLLCDLKTFKRNETQDISIIIRDRANQVKEYVE